MTRWRDLIPVSTIEIPDDPSSGGYLSRNRPYLNKLQRERRASSPRIDYYPSRKAHAVILACLNDTYPDNSLTGVLDRIVTEWAEDREFPPE